MTRLARTVDGTVVVGDEAGFVPVAAADPSIETLADALAAAATGDLPGPDDAAASRIPPAHLRFGSPVPARRKLWGIGLNYVDHAADLDEESPAEEPASFMKPATAVAGPGGPIRLPPASVSERVTAEGELAVVIGRTCKDVPAESVDDVVAGYVPVIDVTAEDILQRNPRFLTRAKSFDSFLVFGPWLVTADEVPDLDAVTVETVVNDASVATNEVRNMMFSPRYLVAFHSRVMTLEAGDVVSTGTPGASPIDPGDEVRASVEGVGEASAPVVR